MTSLHLQPQEKRKYHSSQAEVTTPPTETKKRAAEMLRRLCVLVDVDPDIVPTQKSQKSHPHQDVNDTAAHE